MRKLIFVAGVAVGYVLGSRAGRERYEQIAAMARRVRDNPTVRDVTGKLQDQAEQAAEACKDKLMATSFGERFFGEHDEFDADGELKPRYWETVGVSTSSRDSVEGNGPKDS